MSSPITFLPWLRSGLGLGLTEREPEALTGLSDPATLEAFVAIDEQEANATLALRPPHLISRIDTSQISRRYPGPNVTDAQYGFFPLVELTAPDLPWLASPFTPDEGTNASSSTGKIRPWFVLVCVPTPLCSLGADATSQTFTAPVSELPDLEESWAWAHVHSTATPEDTAAAAETPDGSVLARMICPRRLQANTRYRAALVLAWRAQGTGMEPAWLAQDSGDATLRCYDTWTFTTGDVSSFEELCDRLGPVTGGSAEFGINPMDLGNAGLPGIWDDIRAEPRADYSGAISSVDAKPKTEPEVIEAFKTSLGELFDATATRREATASGPDPIVSIPLYGSFAAGTTTVPDAGWLAQVNKSPNRRAAAGIGADLVRIHQERFVAAAWDQLGAVAETNRLLGRAVLRREVAQSWKTRAMALDPEQLAGVLRPQTTFLKAKQGPLQSTPMRQAIARSTLPTAVTSPALARIMRPSFTVRKSLTATIRRNPNSENAQIRKQWKRHLTQQLGTDASREDLGLDGPRMPSGTRLKSGTVAQLPTRPVLTTTLTTEDLKTDIGTGLAPAAYTKSQSLLRVPALAGVLPKTDVVPPQILVGPSFQEALSLTLMEMSPDLLMPGAQDYPVNTLGLLDSEPSFIAAFLAGANHEMIRELIWREVPTPLDHTPFQRFWARPDPALNDIDPMEGWKTKTPLKELGAASGEAAILMVRGDVLRQFPSTRFLLLEPEKTVPMAPSFSGRIPTDMAFFGFDVPDADAVTALDSKWLVIIEEPAFEPRFGLDDGGTTSRLPDTFSEIDWAHMIKQTTDHLTIGTEMRIANNQSLLSEAEWGLNSAHMARATFQQPFRKYFRAPDIIGGRS